MRILDIDIETTATVDLVKCGVYKYAESADFAVTLFGYSVDDGPVHVIDLANGEHIPKDVLAALTDDAVLKYAHNCAFERVCLSRYLGLPSGTYLSPVSWRCTMVWASYLGLPQSLKDVGTVLGLSRQKLEEGKELIKYFCTGKHTPQDDPVRWAQFKRYNKRDVETEMEIRERLAAVRVPETVWQEFIRSEYINDTGVRVDLPFVRKAIELDEQIRGELTDALRKITDLDNPNSVPQMKQWLADNGLETDTLGKKAVEEMLKTATPELREVLTLRQQLAKSSVKKYTAMEKAACADGRVRGMFRFYGAHTGRFSSKILNLQNLAQNHLEDLDSAKALVLRGTLEDVKAVYPNVPDTLSQLLRTAFIPDPGKLLYVADFSAIEARVIAWLAGEQWLVKAFADGQDIYCETASRMFHVPVEKHGINKELRQKGKQCVLGCSYGGSVGALKAMGALEMGLAEEELRPLVDAWRSANPHIVRLWSDFERVCKAVIREKNADIVHGIRFSYQSGILFVTLPSGRRLAYPKPRIGLNRFGGDSIIYEGIGSTKKWEAIETFGGKLTENIVQAVARDILCEAMRRLSEAGCRIVIHIHDEVVIEAPGSLSLDTVCETMAVTPAWAEGLLLRAVGYTCESYRKD